MDLKSSHLPKTGKLALFCVALFLFTFFLYTRQNQFPFFYHPDEPGKGAQVISRQWNYHHPMLLLATTAATVKIFGVVQQPQEVVVAGRWVSAGLASIAVVAFSLLAFHFHRFAGAIPVGLTLSLHHQFFELAHYMKEDTALLCGVALVLLGMAWFWRQSTVGNTAFLGFACAVAVSGKYLGVVFVALALVLLLIKKREAASISKPTKTTQWLVFMGVFAATAALCNLPLLLDLNSFETSLHREMELVAEGQGGATRSVPHSQYWSIFLDNTNPLLLVGLVTYLVMFFRTRNTRTLPEWILVLLPFAYSLLLSFSPKSNDRYFLPATALFTYLSVLGIIEATRLIKARSQKPGLWLCAVVLLVALQIFSTGRFRGIATYYQAFAHDDIQEHIDFVKSHLPATAVIVQDDRVGLPNPKKTERLSVQPSLTQNVLSKKYASDFGSLSGLPKQEITHVAVSESSYGRFFLKGLKPQKGREDDFSKGRKFYEDLFASQTLIWERKRGTVIYLHPGIRLYELRRGARASSPY